MDNHFRFEDLWKDCPRGTYPNGTRLLESDDRFWLSRDASGNRILFAQEIDRVNLRKVESVFSGLTIYQDLGITVEEDRDGVLQDVHWSAGLFGYFPTYTLGNLIGAQLFASAETAIDDLHQNLANGQFDKLLEWSRDKVHRHGRTMNSEEIVKNATGDTLSPEYLINYLKNKLEPLYGI